MNSKDTSKNKGFTLIELLVVISIIGVLAGLVLVSFTGSQKQARDVERKSDIKQYQTALESFANGNNGLYPSRSAGTGQPSATVLCGDLGMTNCPEDPRNAQDSSYQYRYQSNGTGWATINATDYVLWALLEKNSEYWVVCSDGKSGTIDAGTWNNPSGGACPL